MAGDAAATLTGTSDGWLRCADGSHTRHAAEFGQAYHSLSGAREEAERRFVAGCRLRWLLAAGPVSVLDVGFGLGWNAAAALRVGQGQPLQLVSFERDPEILAWAGRFPHPEEYKEACRRVRQLAAQPEVEHSWPDGGSARLLLGDARESVARLPELAEQAAVFLDAFSPNTNPELWQAGFLTRLAERLPRRTLLATYSAATAVRLALLQAGFRLGRGPRVGSKASGSLATLDPQLPLPGFAPRQARKLRRWYTERIGQGLPPDAVAE